MKSKNSSRNSRLIDDIGVIAITLVQHNQVIAHPKHYFSSTPSLSHFKHISLSLFSCTPSLSLFKHTLSLSFQAHPLSLFSSTPSLSHFKHISLSLFSCTPSLSLFKHISLPLFVKNPLSLSLSLSRTPSLSLPFSPLTAVC